MATKLEVEAAQDILRLPSAKDLEAVRERRLVLKDILNTNLLSPEARRQYDAAYAESGRILSEAVAQK
ncbi:MAG: hypothetical protein ACHQ7M_17505 [Chloroflexota bacterium]|jgi:hypothetical protein